MVRGEVTYKDLGLPLPLSAKFAGVTRDAAILILKSILKHTHSRGVFDCKIKVTDESGSRRIIDINEFKTYLGVEDMSASDNKVEGQVVAQQGSQKPAETVAKPEAPAKAAKPAKEPAAKAGEAVKETKTKTVTATKAAAVTDMLTDPVIQSGVITHKEESFTAISSEYVKGDVKIAMSNEAAIAWLKGLNMRNVSLQGVTISAKLWGQNQNFVVNSKTQLEALLNRIQLGQPKATFNSATFLKNLEKMLDEEALNYDMTHLLSQVKVNLTGTVQLLMKNKGVISFAFEGTTVSVANGDNISKVNLVAAAQVMAANIGECERVYGTLTDGKSLYTGQDCIRALHRSTQAGVDAVVNQWMKASNSSLEFLQAVQGLFGSLVVDKVNALVTSSQHFNDSFRVLQNYQDQVESSNVVSISKAKKGEAEIEEDENPYMGMKEKEVTAMYGDREFMALAGLGAADVTTHDMATIMFEADNKVKEIGEYVLGFMKRGQLRMVYELDASYNKKTANKLKDLTTEELRTYISDNIDFDLEQLIVAMLASKPAEREEAEVQYTIAHEAINSILESAVDAEDAASELAELFGISGKDAEDTLESSLEGVVATTPDLIILNFLLEGDDLNTEGVAELVSQIVENVEGDGSVDEEDDEEEEEDEDDLEDEEDEEDEEEEEE